MAPAPGHDLGQPPPGLTWGRYVEALVDEAGSWTALADALVFKLGANAPDRGTAERGLRRLAARDNKAGGSYGGWVLRVFGVPRPVADHARWVGQYHGRFADLPVAVREDLLRLWDRPPAIESAVAAWIHLGLASAALSRRDPAAAIARLDRARATAPRAGPEAEVESLLLAAFLANSAPSLGSASAPLAAVGPLLERVSAGDHAAYRARWLDQRAYAVLHPTDGSADVSAGLALYEAIAPDTTFAGFRREHGRAYCLWKLGRRDEAAAAARLAADHAGDGGYVRFRVLSLDLLTRLVDGDEAAAVRSRAVRMARALEDEDLLARLARAGR